MLTTTSKYPAFFDAAVARDSQLWPHLDHIDHSRAVVQKLDEKLLAE